MTEPILNGLPAATWNHLGVNRAAVALPSVPIRQDSPTVYTGGIAGVTYGDSASDSFPVSGAGSALDELVESSAGFQLHLTVCGRAETPVRVEHTLDGAHPQAVAHLTVHAGADSRVTLIEILRGGAAQGLHASLTQVFAEPGAEVTLIQLLLTESDAASYTGVAARCQEGAAVRLYRAILGGSLALCGSNVLLEGRSSAYSLQNVYYGGGSAVLDFSDTAVHTGRETHSELHAAGVLAGQCQKTLRGTIDFRRGAVHGVGHESEDVLLLSPDVRNRTSPLILCGEEQVEGQHAASAGRLDERLLYYMASRGLDAAAAKRLVALAKFAPVLDALPPELRCEAEQFMEGRLTL